MARKRKVKEADRLRQNLTRRIRDAEKRGFQFSDEFEDEIIDTGVDVFEKIVEMIN